MEAELVTSTCQEDAAPLSLADGIPSMGMSHGVCGQASQEPRWPQRGAHGVALGAGAVRRWAAGAPCLGRVPEPSPGPRGWESD